MNYTIRKAVPSDIEEIIRLCGEHAEYERADYTPEGKSEQLASFLFAENPRLHCLIAAQGTETIGYATYMFEFSTWDACLYAHMDCLYLRPHARGYGVGEALVKHIAQAAREQGCKIIQCHTPSFNERAIKFYHRIGAVSKEKLRFYVHDETIDNLIK